MPLNILASLAVEGTSAIPYFDTLKVWVPAFAALFAVKSYFAGSQNTWTRDLHGRVILLTGGTSGIGAVMAKEYAERGAQLVLLVRRLDDGWLAEYIDELRNSTGNPLIHAEEANLADLHSVRKFATKWIDNMPPRRLDMVVCCAAVATPPTVPRAATPDGVEVQMQVNYLAHYHLLTILAPALRSQPPDRDVRVLLTTCVSGVMGDLDISDLTMTERAYDPWGPHRVLGASKLALSLFGYEFQRQLNAYERQDKAVSNVHIAIVDPGMMRSPSFKRFFSFGSVWGLLVYLILWPIFWLFLKSSRDGAQSLLFASMSPEIGERSEVSYISESKIRVRPPPRNEFQDEEFQKALFERTEAEIKEIEKASVLARKRAEKSTPKTSATDAKPQAKKRTNATKS